MQTIYKYQLLSNFIGEVNRIEVPKDAELLTIQKQNGHFCIWFKVDTEKPKTVRSFIVFGTGWDMSSYENLKYIDTVLDNGFVWHVFEIF